MKSNADRNTVAAGGQLPPSQYLSYEGTPGRGPRILIAGNSITRHGPKPEIGWHGDWGMAASAKEKDYAHRLMRKTRGLDCEASFCLAQVSAWERAFWQADTLSPYEAAKAFDADLCILRFGENIPRDSEHLPELKDAYKRLIKALAPRKETKLLFTTGFWRLGAVDECIQTVARELHAPCVPLGELGQREDRMALGLFAHDGVARHPGDLGMEAIAEAIWRQLEPMLL